MAFDPSTFVEGPDGSEHAAHAMQKKLALDSNGDGQIDFSDCPYQSGSAEAKKWFYETVDPAVKTVTPGMKAKFGDKCIGMFNGKPLIPGEKGSVDSPQADFDYMKFKLQVTQGLSPESATAITAQVAKAKYGVGNPV